MPPFRTSYSDGISVVDWVVCSADKVIDSKPAMQGYKGCSKMNSKVLFRERREPNRARGTCMWCALTMFIQLQRARPLLYIPPVQNVSPGGSKIIYSDFTVCLFLFHMYMYGVPMAEFKSYLCSLE